ncbi:MAG: protein translocase subunit SecF [Candidatus Sungbacteria bacterium]|nr:protein translocase subunit SecF [Candidatus Sungbacteria bacterium]
MNIIQPRKIFYYLSGILMAASIIMLAVFGLKEGIDFTGGSLLEIEYRDARPDSDAIRKTLEPLELGNIVIQQTGKSGVIIRMKDIDEPTHQNILGLLNAETEKNSIAAGIQQKRFDTIGPTIGRELRNHSILAIAIVLFLILSYIAWAFRKVSKPVASWKYGVVALVALFHDVFIPTGVFAFLGKFYGVEADTLFVTAVLTVLGFSVHDTIVVFDRVRENLKKNASREMVFADVVGVSVEETIVRSINTSFTVLLSLLAVFFFGGESIRYFILALIIGVIVGTYSSIFIASPLLVSWHLYSTKNIETIKKPSK